MDLLDCKRVMIIDRLEKKNGVPIHNVNRNEKTYSFYSFVSLFVISDSLHMVA